MANTTASITWEGLEDIVSSAKKQLGPEMFSSYQSMITHQNALVSWLAVQLDLLAEARETKEARMTAKACHSLWGNLYQMEESEEEENRRKDLTDFFVAFANESESPWVTVTFTMAMVRFSLEGAIYLASQAAENGNTNAMKNLSNFKANKEALEDIAESICEIAGL